jgi:tetratricopeptide (TPR) repeat protein
MEDETSAPVKWSGVRTLGNFSREQVARMLGVESPQIRLWEQLNLTISQAATLPDEPVYSLADIARLRLLKQATESGIGARSIREALDRLDPASVGAHGHQELRLELREGRIAAVLKDKVLDLRSGQFLLNFEPSPSTGGISSPPLDFVAKTDGEHQLRSASNVLTIPGLDARQWFETALRCERESATRTEAIEAYRQVISVSPDWVEARINLGTLLYEEGNLQASADSYVAALALAPHNPLVHYNLGSVLDEMGQLEEARGHLLRAVEIEPQYSDAHYNLARIHEKLGEPEEARRHWQKYLALDPDSAWSVYARQRLESAGPR